MLDLEFTEPKKCKNFHFAKSRIPKGFRLPSIDEIIKIYLHHDGSTLEDSPLITYKKGKFLAFYTKELFFGCSYCGQCYWFLRGGKEDSDPFSISMDSITSYENDDNESHATVIYVKENELEIKKLQRFRKDA